MNKTQRYEKASKLILVSVLFGFITLIFTNIAFGRTLAHQSSNIIALIITGILAILLLNKNYNWIRILILVFFFISIPLSLFSLLKAYNFSGILFQLLLIQFIFTSLGVKNIIRK